MLLSIYISFCAGSYFASVNQTGFLSLERVGQIKLNMIFIDTIDKNYIDRLRNTILQSTELELLNVIDVQSEMEKFSIIGFLSAPWYLARYRLEVEDSEILLFKERLEQLKKHEPP